MIARNDEPPDISRPISLRPMTVQDIPFGLKLSSLAGWNQTEADWRMLLENSTAGSFVACWGGKAVGTVTAVTYENHLSWIGMMLVAKEYQRLGIGSALLQAAIQAVEGYGAVCLDATPAGRPLYEKHGFRALYPLARWLRPPSDLEPAATEQPASTDQPAATEQTPAALEILPTFDCRPLTAESLPTVAAYDRPVFGADRGGVLSALQRSMPSLALSIERDGGLAGYCLGRRGLRYIQIGPLVADDLDIARSLLLNALQACASQPVILDIPLSRPGWCEFLQSLGFVEQRPFTRMVLGEYRAPEGNAKLFAIAGPEVG